MYLQQEQLNRKIVSSFQIYHVSNDDRSLSERTEQGERGLGLHVGRSGRKTNINSESIFDLHDDHFFWLVCSSVGKTEKSSSNIQVYTLNMLTGVRSFKLSHENSSLNPFFIGLNYWNYHDSNQEMWLGAKKAKASQTGLETFSKIQPWG